MFKIISFAVKSFYSLKSEILSRKNIIYPRETKNCLQTDFLLSCTIQKYTGIILAANAMNSAGDSSPVTDCFL